MTWTNGHERRFHVGQRVYIPERGQGRVVEVLAMARDIDGNWRTPYRVWLDCGAEWLAHPDRMCPAREKVMDIEREESILS